MAAWRPSEPSGRSARPSVAAACPHTTPDRVIASRAEMDELSPPVAVSKRGSRRWWWVAAVLALIAAGGLLVGLRGQRQSLPGPVLTGAVPSAAGPPTTAVPVGVARSTPVTLSIPAIGLTVPLSLLGLNLYGTVQVPTDVQEPGWFDLGPTPGQVGSSVILGHVDSYRGPAVFYKLSTLSPGDMVDVTLTDGVVTQFVVTSVSMYSKTQFPAQAVYGAHGYSALQLVTCGGTFDSQTGHYLSNVVVFTSLVSSAPTTQ